MVVSVYFVFVVPYCLCLRFFFFLFVSSFGFTFCLCVSLLEVWVFSSFCLYFLESPISAVSDGISTPSGGGGRIRTYVGIASRFTVCPR